MHFVRLATTERPEYDKALALYRESFPYHEQREARSQGDILSDEEYRFELVYDKDIFAGLLLCWETDAFVDENTLTVNVARLRKKLEGIGLTDFIVTKKGVGYQVK